MDRRAVKFRAFGLDRTESRIMKRQLLLTLVCAVLRGVCAPALAASGVETVIVRAPSSHSAVLSSEDARLYRAVFEDESSGQFEHAHALSAEISDRCLMGYVEAEEFLATHKKRIPLAQLVSWLETYGDLPIAPTIYELAEKRNRHHKVQIPAPVFVPARHAGNGFEESDLLYNPPLSSEQARAVQTQIDANIRIDQPAAAESQLQGLAATNAAPLSDIAKMTQRVAASYLAEGQDSEAYRVATGVTGEARYTAPLLDWDAGFAAYRLNKFADAATYFESLAQAGDVPGGTRSAAAFWAARAHMQAGDPLRVVTLLTAAAREQPTFYGMLAERLLGQESLSQFSDPVLDAAGFEALMQNPAAHRADALWQIGRTTYIADEMTRAFAVIDLSNAGAFAALSRQLDLPALELRASESQAKRGVLLTGLLPIPHYTPPGGYHIDPCLVLAFARIESRFEAHAVSGAGARGIMQLMPGTAMHVDGAMPGRSQLDDPAYNLGLGERYLQELIDQTNGNLFQLAAAYNAGPGSLTHWLGARPSIANDPLLFVESLPAPETRIYIKRLMTYYWMYSKRSNRPATTLEDTAEGKWPLYQRNAVPVATSSAAQDPMRISDAAPPD
jgi:soluble lytic murein transglycosylase-like protein